MIIRLILLLVVGVLFSTVEGFGQNTWVKTYGGSRFDKVSSILSNIDHSFLLTGQSRSILLFSLKIQLTVVLL